MIRAVSLMPAPVVQRRRRDRRVRLWVAVGAVAAAAGVAVSLGASRWLGGGDRVSVNELQSASRALENLTLQRETTRREAIAAASTLAAVRAASEHPDWSILLAYISDRCGETVSLTSFVLEPGPGSADFDLSLEGSGASQQDVARFVLALERSGVFTTTRLNSTGRNGSRVTFAATCTIRATPESPTPANGEEEEPAG